MVVLMVVYLSAVALSAVSAFRMATKSQRVAFETDSSSASGLDAKWYKRSLWFLFLYYGNNLLVESIAWTFYFNKVNNSPVYAIGLIFSALTLLLFFAVHSSGKYPKLLFLIFFMVLSGFYIKDKQWEKEYLLTFYFGLLHFSFLAISAAIFISKNLFHKNGSPDKFKIRVGVLFFVYCFLSLFISVLTLEHTAYTLDCKMVFWINYFLAVLFYLTSAAIMWFSMKKNKGETLHSDMLTAVK